MASSHRPARKVRRTSRTALDRWPSAVAIIGEDAVIRPSRKMLKVKVRLSASVAAASCVAPRRPISRTSVAWISLLREIGEDQRPGERQRRAQLLAPRAARSSAEMLPRRPSARHARSCDDATTSKRFGRRRNGARQLASAQTYSRGIRNEVRSRNLETAGRHQGRAGPHLLLIFFFAGLYGALSARPAPVKDGVLDLDLNGSVVEQPARRELVRRRGRQPSRRNIACATSSPRSTRPRDDGRVKAVALDLDGFTGGGADRDRRPCRRGSAGARSRASRSSPMASATPTTATRSPRRRRKSG